MLCEDRSAALTPEPPSIKSSCTFISRWYWPPVFNARRVVYKTRTAARGKPDDVQVGAQSDPTRPSVSSEKDPPHPTYTHTHTHARMLNRGLRREGIGLVANPKTNHLLGFPDRAWCQVKNL